MYQNCCNKCGSTSLHTEVKGNNTGLYCDDCGAWIKWLSKDEIRAFEYTQSKNKEKDLPYVVLDESCDEELKINGETVLRHKRLYPSEILDALEEYGIIKFKYQRC